MVKSTIQIAISIFQNPHPKNDLGPSQTRPEDVCKIAMHQNKTCGQIHREPIKMSSKFYFDTSTETISY